MNISEATVSGLDGFLKEHLEADVVAIIAERCGLSASEAMEVYFGSKVAEAVSAGSFGMQYLPAEYLADEVLGEGRRPQSPASWPAR